MTGPYFSNKEWAGKLKNTKIGKGMTFRETWEKLTDALVYSFITGGFIPTKEQTMANKNSAKPKEDNYIGEREMYERDQRLSCLAHAVDVNRLTNEPDDIINKAKLFYDFIEKGK